MKEIYCIAIDDEPWALQVIEQFCQRKGGIKLITFSEPLVGLSEIKRSEPDLVFLDIEMNSLNGIAIAQALTDKCCFIFTTAHAQYALEGFNLDAVDFLHKPFAYERFEKAVDKALRRIEAQHTKQTTCLTVMKEYTQIIIPTDEILYIEAMENYTKIFRKQGKYVLTRTRLKAIQEKLPDDRFIRIHKSYIIPIDQVESYTHKNVVLRQTPIPIPIGKAYAESFWAKMNSL